MKKHLYQALWIYGILFLIFCICVIVLSIQTNEGFIDMTEEYRQQWSKEYRALLEDLWAEKDSLYTEKNSLLTDINAYKAAIEQMDQSKPLFDGLPESYLAGYYHPGVDFPVGRYAVYGGNGALTIRDEDGVCKADVLLGETDDAEHISKYIYTF